MSDETNYIQIDVRVEVFIICGLLFVVFFIFPICLIFINHALRRLSFYLGCNFFGFGGTDPSDEIDVGTLRRTHYTSLSSTKKTEIERLRNEMLRKCLEPYSVSLMVGRDTTTMREVDDGEFHMGELDGSNKRQCGSSSEEKSQVQPSKTESTEFEVDSDSVHLLDDDENSFTHISIPHPGYDRNCIHVNALACIERTKKNQATFKKRLRSVRNILRGDTREETEQQREPNDALDPQDKRIVTKFCAICLASYEHNEDISWSSNEACTHVFHTKCILTWLSSLGKKWSRNQRFSDILAWDELLGYSLECPCCRQDFVSKLVCVYYDKHHTNEEEGEDQNLSRVSEESV
ncbi:hypothetical protein HJC23_006151 [Cyclotella cryptica]|uniref:RING-type domain-containing protein n=1 Tax=Cyclotella cryptica TaxID=29204 RepID=A0ABD3PBW7_9STRA|eukprot:CCRYP_016129-RA/>CCRYP_016129-RA protein AED:0.15 eAED:0.15 QI:0/-1/0/1/-1/1/1/0/347